MYPDSDYLIMIIANMYSKNNLKEVLQFKYNRNLKYMESHARTSHIRHAKLFIIPSKLLHNSGSKTHGKGWVFGLEIKMWFRMHTSQV